MENETHKGQKLTAAEEVEKWKQHYRRKDEQINTFVARGPGLTTSPRTGGSLVLGLSSGHGSYVVPVLYRLEGSGLVELNMVEFLELQEECGGPSYIYPLLVTLHAQKEK